MGGLHPASFPKANLDSDSNFQTQPKAFFGGVDKGNHSQWSLLPRVVLPQTSEEACKAREGCLQKQKLQEEVSIFL